MKKRILSLVAALALAATITTPVNAAKYVVDATYNSTTLGTTIASDDSSQDKAATDTLTDTHSAAVSSANSDLKPSGAAGAKVNVVTGSAKDNIMDNGIKPAVKEFVKASRKNEAGNGKVGVDSLRGIHYFDLTADQTGDVTFKVDVSDGYNSDALDGDSY
ncbi:MAG: hypothetical protein IJT32_03350, partial [Lachnospiraceae bacterium]|nr:hypothetical protein [Lachnospiraceae bacterium]